MKSNCDQLGAGELARSKLISAASDLFGRRGVEGVSIRQISDLANMNVASISYHFGSKAGLYRAVADSICEQRASLDKESIDQATDYINAPKHDSATALTQVLSIVENMIDVIVPESVKNEKMARFITRFQFSDHIIDHELTKNPLHDLLAILVGIVRNKPRGHLENAIITQTIFGQILVFRVNSLSSKKSIGITSFGSKDVEQIKKVVLSNIQKMLT